MSLLPVPESLLVTPLPPEIILLMEDLNTTPIIVERIRVWINSHPFCSHARQFVQSGWPDSIQDVQLKSFATNEDDLPVQDGYILWENRVDISKTGRDDMLRKLHEAHPGETRMR